MKNKIEQTEKDRPTSVGEALQREDNKNRIQQALSSKINIDEFISNIMIEIHNNPALSSCSFRSIMQCAIDSANFGLVPNATLGHAYLTPFKGHAKLLIGYKGYIKKFAENGIAVETETVTYKEVKEGNFREERGDNPKILHTPDRVGVIRDKESIALAYAIARKPGMNNRVAVMSKEEIEVVAKTLRKNEDTGRFERSLGKVWRSKDRITDYGEMCKKTAIRRLAKVCELNVAIKMSAYEYKVEKEMKDVTPKAPTSMNISDIFGSPDDTPLPPENPAQEKANKVTVEIKAANSKDQIDKILSDNKNHIEAMNEGLINSIKDAQRIKISSLEKTLLEPKNGMTNNTKTISEEKK